MQANFLQILNIFEFELHCITLYMMQQPGITLHISAMEA